MRNKTFVFTTQNPKASRYLLICLLSFVSIDGLSFLPIWALIVLMFGSMLLGFVLFNRHAKAIEKITLYEDHLDSEIFGSVYYETIISARSVTIDTGEGLRLKLQSKKKVWWKALKTEELAIYDAFVNALAEAVSHADLSQIKNGHLKTHDRQEVSFNQEEETPTEEPQPLVEKASVGEEISQVQHKNQNAGNAKTILLIFVGILLAFYGLFKIYAPKWEQQRNEREISTLRQGMMDDWDKKANLQDSVPQIIHQYAHAHGPYYLYTNDATAKVIYLPRLRIEQKQQRGVVSLVADDGRSEKLKAFLDRPDSMPWDVSIENRYTSFRLLDNIMDTYFSKDSAATYIYLGIMNLKADSSQLYDKENKAFTVDFSNGSVVALHLEDDLKAPIAQKAVPFLEFLEKNPKTSRLYVAAREGEGQMDKPLFEKLIEILKEGLVYRNIDTTTFVTETFEE